MAKVIKSKAKEPKSNTPMLIIGAVLVGAVLGGWWYWSSQQPTPATANANTAANRVTSTPRPNTIPANAPPGANPPNLAGSATAAVTLEEFADFQCGSCATANPIMNEIKSLYGSRIKFVFRNYPLTMHDKAYDAAVAAEAAGMQGKFWDMQNQLFSNQKAWATAPTYKQLWKGYAEKIGLDTAKWETDTIGIAAKGRVDADLARGKAIGVSSTPTLYVNGSAIQFTEMTVPALKTMIDAELLKATSQSTSPAAANTGNSSK